MDDSTDSLKAYFDATLRLPDDEADDAPVEAVLPKTHFTDHEFEYGSLGGLLDKLN